MLKNRLTRGLAMFAAIAPLILGRSVAAHGAVEEFVVETEFETTNRQNDATALFPEKKRRDGFEYLLKCIDTEILKEEKVQKDILTLEGEDFVGDPEEHKPEDHIEKEGKKYRLRESTLVETTVEERKKDVTSVIPYTRVEYIDTLPDAGDVEVKDENTKQFLKVKLPYQSHTEVRSYWDNDFSVPLTVAVYDAETYQMGDVEIPKDADLSLYGRELLQYLGLPEEYYRILDIQWSGDPYESNGELRRDALATGLKMLKDIDVTYAGSVTFEKIQARAYNSVYEEVLPQEEDGDVMYTIKASATYEREGTDEEEQEKSFWQKLLEWIINHPILAAICLALIILALWFVLLLCFLAKKRRKEAKATEIIIHEDEGDEIE